MKILLVSNYAIDKQESMVRFAQMLANELPKLDCQVQVIQPEPAVVKMVSKGKSQFPASTLTKWLGYLDKFVMFKPALQRAQAWADIVHVCDHSNSLYIDWLNKKKTLITCHDLLAVRAGLGEETYCPLTSTGKILQRWILEGLKKAKLVVCDSRATQNDARRLLGSKWLEVVKPGLNYPYTKMDEDLVHVWLLKRYDSTIYGSMLHEKPFLLHVGSSQPRKNRDGVIRIFAKVTESFDCNLVFAGSPLEPEQQTLIAELGLNNKVIEVQSPDNEMLRALYSKAFALVFPSKSEGFGWPIIEAQACGCPVLSSNAYSCPEAAGTGALLYDFSDEQGFTEGILRLAKDEEFRRNLISQGYENAKNFNPADCAREYLKLYRKLLSAG